MCGGGGVEHPVVQSQDWSLSAIPFINIVWRYLYLAKGPTLNDGGEFNGPPVEVGSAVAHLHRLVKGIIS